MVYPAKSVISCRLVRHTPTTFCTPGPCSLCRLSTSLSRPSKVSSLKVLMTNSSLGPFYTGGENAAFLLPSYRLLNYSILSEWKANILSILAFLPPWLSAVHGQQAVATPLDALPPPRFYGVSFYTGVLKAVLPRPRYILFERHPSCTIVQAVLLRKRHV